MASKEDDVDYMIGTLKEEYGAAGLEMNNMKTQNILGHLFEST
jgi:hypothetical protein